MTKQVSSEAGELTAQHPEYLKFDELLFACSLAQPARARRYSALEYYGVPRIHRNRA
jgi:hypothetical protein